MPADELKGLNLELHPAIWLRPYKLNPLVGDAQRNWLSVVLGFERDSVGLLQPAARWGDAPSVLMN